MQMPRHERGRIKRLDVPGRCFVTGYANVVYGIHGEPDRAHTVLDQDD
jgi:hypothetical protein